MPMIQQPKICLLLACRLCATVGWLVLPGCQHSTNSLPQTTPPQDTATEHALQDPSPERSASSLSQQESESSESMPPGHETTGDDRRRIPHTDALEVEVAPDSSTRERLIALVNSGPVIVDLSVSIGDQDLTKASQEVVNRIASELLGDGKTLITWGQLLEMPLVKSGWLGNLLADEEQQDQLISMYDTARDDLVSTDELAAFLSRGLSRGSPMQISVNGAALDEDPNESPWGPIDANQDHSLDLSERQGCREEILRFDFNGDGIVTVQELSQVSRPQTQASMRMGSLLDTTTLLVADGIQAEPISEREKAVRRVAQSLLNQYSFLDDIVRDQWSAWTDSRWFALDTSRDGILSRIELERIAELPSDAHISLRLPAWDADENTPTGTASLTAEDNIQSPRPVKWQSTRDGGRLSGLGCIIETRLEDAFSLQAKQMLRQQLQAALADAQLRTLISRQLQLQDGAFQLLDTDGDQMLDDEEFQRVWRWLNSRQGTRLLVRSTTSSRAWFPVFDQDGDGRIIATELTQIEQALQELDTNRDEILTPDELPLIIRLALSRTDSRLNSGSMGLPGRGNPVPAEMDWFGAMDTNGDGVVGHVEFLGEEGDFNDLDLDKDGFLAREEVY